MVEHKRSVLTRSTHNLLMPVVFVPFPRKPKGHSSLFSQCSIPHNAAQVKYFFSSCNHSVMGGQLVCNSTTRRAVQQTCPPCNSPIDDAVVGLACPTGCQPFPLRLNGYLEFTHFFCAPAGRPGAGIPKTRSLQRSVGDQSAPSSSFCLLPSLRPRWGRRLVARHYLGPMLLRSIFCLLYYCSSRRREYRIYTFRPAQLACFHTFIVSAGCLQKIGEVLKIRMGRC